MKNLIFLSALIMLLSGCVSPFAGQREQLNTAYQNGQITYGEFLQLSQNLDNQERQYNIQAIQQFSTQMEQSQARQTARTMQDLQTSMAVSRGENPFAGRVQTNCKSYCNNSGACETYCY